MGIEGTDFRAHHKAPNTTQTRAPCRPRAVSLGHVLPEPLDPGETLTMADRLLAGYRAGAFPMGDPSTGEIDWFEADPRAIIPLEPVWIPDLTTLGPHHPVREVRGDLQHGLRRCGPVVCRGPSRARGHVDHAGVDVVVRRAARGRARALGRGVVDGRGREPVSGRRAVRRPDRRERSSPSRSSRSLRRVGPTPRRCAWPTWCVTCEPGRSRCWTCS